MTILECATVNETVSNSIGCSELLLHATRHACISSILRMSSFLRYMTKSYYRHLSGAVFNTERMSDYWPYRLHV